MKVDQIDSQKVCNVLNEIMEYELAGVVRYTHSSMMVSGPYRLPIVSFLKEQAAESLLHAQMAGEKSNMYCVCDSSRIAIHLNSNYYPFYSYDI